VTIKDITNGKNFATVSDAIRGSDAGDVIHISAGTYTEDFPKITHSLTLVGVGGYANLKPLGSPSNGQGILVVDAPFVRLSHLELSGAAVPDGNGAGVRFETGTRLRIVDSWLHDNQDGLLANGVAGAKIVIKRSRFDHNGAGDGYTHNLYVGQIGLLSVQDSIFRAALGGHEIKSRALHTAVTGSTIADGPTAQVSYSVDLPDGGKAMISGNTIEKGPNTPNPVIIHFGGEAFPVHANSSLTINANTVTNDRAGAQFVLNQSQDAAGLPAEVLVADNMFYGLTTAQIGNDLLAVGNYFSLGSASVGLAVPMAAKLDALGASPLAVDPLGVLTPLLDDRSAEFSG
jgi:hypothetical protein